MIFVKLWQFDPHDRTHVRTHIDKIGSVALPARVGVSVTPLFTDARETVHIEHWEPNAKVTISAAGGAECLVLEGDCSEGKDQLRVHSWLRLPIASSGQFTAGAGGTKVWIKTGHLLDVQAPTESGR